MKNSIKIIAFMFLAASLNSCTTDDSETKQSKEIAATSIYGTWKLQSRTMNEKPQEFETMSFLFTSDYKAVKYTKGGTVSNSGTYTFTGQELSAKFDEKTPISLLNVKVTSITDHELKWEKVMGEGLLEETYTK